MRALSRSVPTGLDRLRGPAGRLDRLPAVPFADRESFLIAAPVVVLSLLAASIPFISSGHLGVPGIGVNNDMPRT